jgi:iron complex transport system permease protein
MRGHRYALPLGLLILMVLACFIGRYPSPPLMSPRLLWEDELARQLIWNLRLPRILAAALLGMALGGGGAVLQMLFRNPLVESGFLGVSQGAAFGAALAILFLPGLYLLLPLSASTFALAGLALSYTLARHLKIGGWVLRLVLAGLVVSALFSAGLGLLKSIADPRSELPELTFWLLGGLWSAGWPDVYRMAPVVLPSLLLIYTMRWRISILALDEATAFSLGIATGRERALLLLAAVAATASVVSVAGIVGWIGLLVPHIARRALGTDARRSIPGSMWLGGGLALVCDTVARTLIAGEIPLGILTSLVGALGFAILLVRRQEVARA